MILPMVLPYKRLKKAVALFVAVSFLFSSIAFAETPKTSASDVKPKGEVTTDPSKIVIPRDYGLVKSRYNATDSKKLVVHIQDAHCNYEAQSNIVKILECLIKNDGLALISVEGADGFIDTSWFKAFPDADIRKEVADYFMKKGEITGPEFLSITSNYPIKLFGAETRAYYIENLNAFTSSYPLKEDTEKHFNQVKAALNKLKMTIYSSELKELDEKMQDYESKKITFTDYVKYLEEMSGRYKLNMRQYDNLFKLVSVLVYEKKINFSVVDKERSNLIDAITKKLDKEQLAEIVNKSLEFKMGKISSAEYYDYIKTLSAKYGVALSNDYPNLFNYIIYNSVYSRIENENLFKDIKKFESALKEKLFANEDQRALDKLSHHINILLGLINIRLLNDDFDYYKAHQEDFAHEVFASFISKMAAKFGFAFEISDPSDAVRESMSKLEDFYKIAIKRDKALVDNTIQAMRKESAQVSVLVTGGFHSEGIAKLLEQQGVSYIVVCPNITKDVETPYIKILTNQRTPLEDILSDTAAATETKNTKGNMLAPQSRTQNAASFGFDIAWANKFLREWLTAQMAKPKTYLPGDPAPTLFFAAFEIAVNQNIDERLAGEQLSAADRVRIRTEAAQIAKKIAPGIIADLLKKQAKPDQDLRGSAAESKELEAADASAVGAIRVNGGGVSAADHGTRLKGHSIYAKKRLELARREKSLNGALARTVSQGNAYALVRSGVKLPPTDVPIAIMRSGSQKMQALQQALGEKVPGASFIVVKGFKEELARAGLLHLQDVVFHYGVTRQAIYIDEDDFNYLFSFPDGVDRIVQGATHEAAHIDNELANLNNPEVKLLSEAEIERIAPSDKVRKAMLERLMKKLNEEGGQKFDPKKDGALLASQLKNLTPAQIDAFQDKIYASMAALFASLTRKDINGDIFRDYDYRLRDEVIPPEIAFGMAVSWAKMAVQRAEKEGIKSRTAILARDCRLANPNVLKAIELGLRYVGLDVVYVGQESPNCVSDYSWAVRLTYKNGRGNVEQPILGVFRTSSHVALDKQINGFDAVDGFKVIIKSSREGELNSLTVPEIKTESRSIIEGLVGNPDNIKAAAAANTPGTYSTEDIKEGFVKMSALTARLAANPQPGRTVFDLDEAISTAPDVAELLKTWMQNVPPSRPMEGRTIVIDGAHTPSGALARKVFEALGARVILLNGEPRELSGMHRADPSKKANLAATMLAMTREKADLGLAFDLDGDRCAIMYAKKDVPQEVLAGFSRFDHNKSDEINNKDLDTIGVALSNYIEDMPPDNLIAVQLEFLIKQCGYTKEALAAKGKKGIVVIRDVLGTEAVDKVAEDLSRKTGIDIKCVTANAGYVYLKRLRAKYEAEGYVVAIYGESSGHGWTRATGPIENPITLSAMFGVMYSNYTSSPATLGRSVKDMMDEKIVVPYRRSGRFDPLYDKEFIKMLAALPEVPQQAKEQYASGKIPQIVIALGQDYVIRHIQKDFKVGNVVETGFGKLEVAQLDTWKDDGLYRYADIRFNLNGKYAGRCIFRASSNDPNFTCSFETPYIKDESQNDKYPEITRARFALVGGIFMNWLETQHEIERGKSVSFSPISDRPFKNNMMVLPQLVQARMAIGKLPESVVNVQDVYDLVRVMRPTFESLKSDASLKNNAVEYTIPAKSGAEYKLTVSYVQDKPGAFDLALSRNASGRTEELARKQINDVYEKIFKNNEFALGDFIDNAVKTIEKDVAPIELAAAQAAAAEKTFDHTLDVIMKSSDTGERARKLAEGVSAKAPPAKAGRHLIFVKSAIPDEQLKTTTVINYANFCADYYNELEGYTADIVDTYKDAIELLSKNKDWDKTNTIVGLIDSASLDQMASALKNEQMEGKTKLLSMERFSNDQFVPLKGFFDLMSVLVQVNRALDKPDDQELKDAIRELLDNIGVRDVDSLMKALSVAAYFEDPIKFAKNFIVKLLPPTKPASPTELRDRYNAAKKVIESL